ncbi:MAG: BadF/BadG/BcrA/BcrD ATPase family protein [Candidatus Sulfotelmatobacter sp.]
MAFYLGIDGGGSKTTCAVGDENLVIATVTAGPSNITRVGETGARESLHRAIREACAAAKITPREVQRACIGVAGVGRVDVAAIVRKIVAELISGEIEVVGDMPIALESAFGAGPGVVVIAGTGSFAYGRNAQGKTARAGGWGFAVSDEGSAYWIGRTAVTGLFRAIDQKTNPAKDAETVAQDSLLLRELKTAWKLQSLSELVRTANSNPEFAALFSPIVAAADGGDGTAQSVLAQAGRELAQLAEIVVHLLFAEDNVRQPTVPLAVAGGVFRHSQRVREVFCDEIHKLDSRTEVNPQVVEPVAGALRMARRGGTA